uniref:CxC2-like cysteine cluster KDZ transposase-associated domain-containing protein n=1 Tax=Mycena chlorophos TaxID=658473 RepID=A0ABQ0KZI3_MYCCL|nr:predicted protein [Mycena chlorophos]
MSRRTKRRREELAELEENIQSFAITAPPPLPPLPYPTPIRPPSIDPLQPPPPKPKAPPRRAALLQEFEGAFEEIGNILLEREFNPHIGKPCSCNQADQLATTTCRDCTAYPIACSNCFIQRHLRTPFHWAEVWDAKQGFFLRHDISKLGFTLQLGHPAGEACREPVGRCLFTVVDCNGIHSTRLAYCGCCLEQPPNKLAQLLRAGLFPASTKQPLTAFTLTMLREFQLHNFESKKAAYDYMKAIRRLTDNSFTADVADPYAAFLSVVRVYNYLTLRKRTGQLHGIDLVLKHRPSGNLLVWCPACPEPGLNSDPNCPKTPHELRHLNQVQHTADGNFQCNQFAKNTDPNDVSLCNGKGYFPLDSEYREYLDKVPPTKEKSTCNYLNVVNKQDKKKFKNMAVTGTINIQCSHVFILATVDLHAGERYANADKALAIELLKWRTDGGEFRVVLKFEVDDVDRVMTYDIACEYTINLRDRFRKSFPELVPLLDRIRWGIPALHVQGHQESCAYLYGTAYMPCVGHFHGETAEHYWPEANQLGGHVRQMNNGHRQDTLINHHGDWNFKKMAALAATLANDLALAETNYIKKLTHLVGLSASFREHLETWRAMPRVSNKTGGELFSVYRHNATKVPSQQAIYQKLVKDDESFARTAISKGKIASFLDEALKIQELQQQLSALLIDRSEHDLIARKKETDNRTAKLQTRLDAWRKTQKNIMPSVGDLVAAQAQEITPVPIHEEKLFIPSQIPDASKRIELALDDLAAEESRWREGQMFDLIRAIQNNVKAENALRRNKAKNDRQQKQNSRSGAQIADTKRRRSLLMTGYSTARAAQITLTGGTSFPELTDDDLYMKPVLDKRRVGDSRISDGALWTALAPAPSITTEEPESDSESDEEFDLAMEVDEISTATVTTAITATGTQMDRRQTFKKRRTQPKASAEANPDERPSGWIWQLGKFAKMNDAEMDAWSHEGDRVQWFRAEAEMQRWREQREQKIAELLRARRSFLRMAQTWNTLADLNAEKPGYSAYGHQKAAMFTRMAREVEERIKEAGYGELLAPDAKLVDWVAARRKAEDLEFEKAINQTD